MRIYQCSSTTLAMMTIFVFSQPQALGLWLIHITINDLKRVCGQPREEHIKSEIAWQVHHLLKKHTFIKLNLLPPIISLQNLLPNIHCKEAFKTDAPMFFLFLDLQSSVEEYAWSTLDLSVIDTVSTLYRHLHVGWHSVDSPWTSQLTAGWVSTSFNWCIWIGRHSAITWSVFL